MSDTDLADVATSGQDAVEDIGGAQQDPFEDTDYSKVKFLGVQYDALETNLKIGDHVTVQVQGVVIGAGDRRMKDGHVRHTIEVDVQSVQQIGEA